MITTWAIGLGELGELASSSKFWIAPARGAAENEEEVPPQPKITAAARANATNAAVRTGIIAPYRSVSTGKYDGFLWIKYDFERLDGIALKWIGVCK